MVTKWAQHVRQYERFDAYKTVFKEKLVAAYDSHYFQTLCNKTLCDDLLGYMHVCVSKMLDHLLDQCLAITDTEKAEKLEAKRLSKEKKERKKVPVLER